MKASNPKSLSIIVPVFNNTAYLMDALNSILQQPEMAQLKVEIIIINDGSTNTCKETLVHLEQEIAEIKVIHHKINQGPAAARNSGIQEAQGEIIGFLDADDLWPKSKLKTLLSYFQDPKVDIVGGKIEYQIDDDSILPEIQFQNDQNHLNHVHLGAILVHRKVFDRGLLFDISTRYSEDINWWLQIRENRLNVILVEEVTLLYRVHGTNMSLAKDFKALELLQVFHQSLKRRRETAKGYTPLPQLNDFRRFDTPLVSVIIPLFNGSKVIERAIESLLIQSYKHFEVIVVDDGSSDEGAKLVAQKYPNIIVITQTNQGQAAARNAGIKHSKGRLIAFLDQDDEWMAEKLKYQVNMLLENPYVGFVTCNYLIKFESGTDIPKNYQKYLHEHRCFASSALMIRKHILVEVSAFDKSMSGVEDLELIGRLRKAGVSDLNVDKHLLNKWYNGDNMSLDIDKMRSGLFKALRKQVS